jgi:predicted O-methyltransferase YrrM
MNGQIEPENWLRWLKPFIGQPVKALELGCFNGTASAWMLANILTHPDAFLMCVDSLEGIPSLPDLNGFVLEAAFEERTRPWSNRVNLIRGTTQQVLPLLMQEHRQFDFFYIDASHVARDVLFDAVCCYRLAKVGSVMIFDDYGLNWDLPDLPCKVGVDAFLAAHAQHFRVIGGEYQLAVEVTKL